MGGLVAVAAPVRASARARAGALAMRRRTRHALVVHDGGDAALAFCGPRGGLAHDPATEVAVVLDGELLLRDRMNGSADAAEQLLRLYLAHGEALEPPDGQFAAVVWDPRSRSLTVVTDLLGTRPVYVARAGDAVLLASELKALVAAGLRPELDLQTWAEILACEHAFCDRTPLAGARLLPDAATVAFDERGGERRLERRRYRFEPRENGDEHELVEEFGRLLDTAVVRRRGDTVGLSLSGGLDSRCLAAVLAARALRTHAVTFGAARSEELGRAREVARILGLDHTAIVLPAGYIAEGAAEVVWLTEGRIRCLHAHHLALRALRGRHGLDALLIGYAGDVVARAAGMSLHDSPGAEGALVDALHRRGAVALDDELAADVLTPAFAAELRGRARAGVAEALAAEEGPADVRQLQFLLRNVYRHKVLPGAELFADDLAHRDPYVDADLLAFLSRLPLSMRTEGELQRAFLRRTPLLARVPNPKDGFPPALTGRRLSLARRTARVARGAAGRLDGVLRRAGRPPRGGLGDYAADLRRAGGASLLGILLEPRTLERGQLRGRAVRRLVDETLHGGRSRTHVLGVLLTFELFQRQFLEGEAPAGVGGDGAGPTSGAPAAGAS